MSASNAVEEGVPPEVEAEASGGTAASSSTGNDASEGHQLGGQPDRQPTTVLEPGAADDGAAATRLSADDAPQPSVAHMWDPDPEPNIEPAPADGAAASAAGNDTNKCRSEQTDDEVQDPVPPSAAAEEPHATPDSECPISSSPDTDSQAENWPERVDDNAPKPGSKREPAAAAAAAPEPELEPAPEPAPEPDPADGETPRVMSFLSVQTAGGTLCVSAGDVTEFGIGTGWARRAVAIVNAANRGGLGGGGVDGAICRKGGPLLDADRRALPVVPKTRGRERIRTGRAVSTGPPPDGEDYLDLYGHYVFHAVGPDYRDGRSEEEMYLCDQQLESAYACSMQLALEKRIEYLAFPLLSAGVFKGRRPIEAVLRIAVDTIWEKLEFAHSDVAADGQVPAGQANAPRDPPSVLKEVHLVGFSDGERSMLQHTLTDKILERDERALRHGLLLKRGKMSWNPWKQRWFEFSPCGEKLLYYDVSDPALVDVPADDKPSAVHAAELTRATLSEMRKQPDRRPPRTTLLLKGSIDLLSITTTPKYTCEHDGQQDQEPTQEAPQQQEANGSDGDDSLLSTSHLVTVDCRGTNRDRGVIELRAVSAEIAKRWVVGITCAMDSLQRRHMRRVEVLRNITVVITDPQEVRSSAGESFTVYAVVIKSLTGGKPKQLQKRYNDFHHLHGTVSKASELSAEVLSAAAFPEKHRFASMLGSKDLVAERTKQLTDYIEYCKQAIVDEQPQPTGAGGGVGGRRRLLTSAGALIAFLQLREETAMEAHCGTLSATLGDSASTNARSSTNDCGSSPDGQNSQEEQTPNKVVRPDFAQELQDFKRDK